jgi:hypothetical protein
MRLALRRSVTAMVPGYRSSSVKLSNDEGQAERAPVRAGLGVVDRAEQVDCGIDPAVEAPVLLECPPAHQRRWQVQLLPKFIGP